MRALLSGVSRRPGLGLFVVALGTRLAILAATYDVPGDGPSRALAAHEWAQSPSVPTWGIWPPGFLFLSGPVEALLHDPWLSSRLLNVALGSATVPLLYLLALRLFGATVALASAAVLCVLPLHVGLSASSLSEPAFVFELVGALWLLIGAADDAASGARLPSWRVAAGVISLVLASMTRYETWTLLPLFVVHHLARTRRLRSTLYFAVALGAFPVLWTISNYVHTGDALIGFTAATIYVGIPAAPATAAQALGLFVKWSEWQLGWVLPAALLVGAAWELARVARRRGDADHLLYVAVVWLQWLVLLRFAMVRGEYVWTRYLIGSLVLPLPLAFVPWAGVASRTTAFGALPAGSGRRAAALAAMAIVGLYLPWIGEPERAAGHFVTTRRPVTMEELVTWLRDSGRIDQTILLTPMWWDAGYVMLGAPELAARSLILSEWTDDGGLRWWVRRYRPTLLVTRDGDEAYVARIRAALDGYPLDGADVLFRSELVRVLDISRATAPDRLTSAP